MMDNTVKTLTSYHAVKSGGENSATHQMMYIVANILKKNNISSLPFLLYKQFSFTKYILTQGHSWGWG
jgi:hypothetical protein